jgi:GTPase SAR1 family protein
VSASAQSCVNTKPVQFFPPITITSLLPHFIVSDDVLSCRTLDGDSVRTGEGFIVAYSITSRESFKKTSQHRKILRIKSKDDFSMLLVGNKCDLEYER